MNSPVKPQELAGIVEGVVVEMNDLATMIDSKVKPNLFALLVFTEGRINFISNANKSDMLKAMAEFVRLHSEQPLEGVIVEKALHPLYPQAKELVMAEGKASTSFIQRKLRIDYSTAARLVDLLESTGIVSAANHVGKREILRTN